VANDDKGVVRIDVLGQTEDNNISLGFKSSEETIPHNQYSAVIAIEVLAIAPVMDAVRRRGVQHGF